MAKSMHETRRIFSETFGTLPGAVAQAPGRVEVLGNHTDYNEGVVLSAAIDKFITIAVAESSGEEFEFYCTSMESRVSVSEPKPQDQNTWVNYPLGVWAMLQAAGYPVRPFRLLIQSTIPMGAGLSSSAAFEVATGLALSSLFGFEVEPKELARLCQKAEHEYCGAKCGLLDQYSVLFGRKDHVLYIDFRNLDYRAVPLPSEGISLCITPSGVTHALVASAYNDRRAECFAAAEHFARTDSSVKALRDISMERLMADESKLDPTAFRRAKHVVGENERVLKGITFLQHGQLAEFGRLLFESHQSSRDNFENSCPELDTLVEIAGDIDGVYGSRLSGGGFGGATLSVVDSSRAGSFTTAVPAEYARRTTRTTGVHVASIADGARVVKG